jgi:VCBS repeat-containing protein
LWNEDKGKDMAGSAYFILEGEGSEGLGTSIAGLGNFDSSSAPGEFIIGTSNQGLVAAIIYSGASSSVDGIPQDGAELDSITFSTGAGQGTGAFILGGADLVGGSETDIAISAPQANGGNGAVYIISGSSGAVSTGGDLTEASASVTTITGFTGSGGFGTSLATSNGNLLIGGPTHDAGRGGVATVDLAAIAPVANYTTTGTNLGDAFGASIAGGFDLDDDGIDDTAVGAPGADSVGSSDVGSVIVNASDEGTITYTGAGFTDGAGTIVSSAGDFNNHGFDDLLISAPLNDAGGANAGAVYIIFGKAQATDFAPTYDLANLALADGIRLIGANPGDQLGIAVTNLGDASGDGIDDILIAGVDANGVGTAYLVYGYDSTANGHVVSGLTTGVAFTNINTGLFGGALTIGALGDINNDGISDFAFGAPDAAFGAGQVFGVLGGLSNLDTLDDADGSDDGAINVAAFLDGTPPPAPFIDTNINVTFLGVTTGGIDVPSGQTVASGLVGLTDVNNAGASFQTATNLGGVAGSFGTLVITDDGEDNDQDRWTYTLLGSSVLFLGAGETATDQIILTASNGSQRAISVTITGENDPTEYVIVPNPLGITPTGVLPGGSAFGISEDLATVTGTFLATDPDQNDTPNFAGQILQGTFGTFTVNNDGTFTYQVNQAALPTLGNGEFETETITPLGGDSFSFTIVGSDDPASGTDYTLVSPNVGGMVGVNVAFGSGNENVTGTPFDDIIETGDGNDSVNGGAGNDTITDSFGNDSLDGGAGNDDVAALTGTNTITDSGTITTETNYLKGGVGRDTITGGVGIDFIDGDAASSMIGAADILDGGAGNDYLRGGLGTDTFVFRAGMDADIVANFDVEESSGFVLGASPLTQDFIVGLDQVQLIGFTFADLTITNGGNGAVITAAGAVGDSLTLVGVTADALTADSFIFLDIV